MEEQLSDNGKMQYLIQKLSQTKIDQVYMPIIASIITRRSGLYNLNDEIFKRDVDSFVNNIEEIEVKKLPKNDWARYETNKRKIVINSKLFKSENLNLQEFYEAIVHEFTHAMNFEENGNGIKQDRTFPDNNNISTMEAFTECEADALVFGASVSFINDGSRIGTKVRKTAGYSSITHYIDVIAATFGVNRNELLGNAIKGPEQLQNFLNSHIDITYQDSNKNRIFEGISHNINLFHRARGINDPEIRIDNLVAANSKIYTFSEEGINERIDNLECSNLEIFQDQFNNIKISQTIVNNLIETDADDGLCKRFKEGTAGKFDLVNIKFLSIEEILKNNFIENKQELIQKIQGMQDLEEITRFIEEKEINIDTNMEIEDTIPLETLKQYEKENTSIQWDNTEIIDYIKENIEEIQKTRTKQLSKIQLFMENAKFKMNSILNKIGNLTNKIFSKEEPKLLLPEGIKRTELPGSGAGSIKEEIKPWDLANYGIDKEKFNEGTIRIVEENLSRDEESTHTEQEETHEMI